MVVPLVASCPRRPVGGTPGAPLPPNAFTRALQCGPAVSDSPFIGAFGHHRPSGALARAPDDRRRLRPLGGASPHDSLPSMFLFPSFRFCSVVSMPYRRDACAMTVHCSRDRIQRHTAGSAPLLAPLSLLISEPPPTSHALRYTRCSSRMPALPSPTPLPPPSSHFVHRTPSPLPSAPWSPLPSALPHTCRVRAPVHPDDWGSAIRDPGASPTLYIVPFFSATSVSSAWHVFCTPVFHSSSPLRLAAIHWSLAFPPPQLPPFESLG